MTPVDGSRDDGSTTQPAPSRPTSPGVTSAIRPERSARRWATAATAASTTPTAASTPTTTSANPPDNSPRASTNDKLRSDPDDRLALEQCKSPLVGPRRRIGPRRSAAGDGSRLARLAQQCDLGGGATRFARARPYRLPLAHRDVCGASGANGRPQAPSRKTRPSIEITQTTIIGSCPRNPRRLTVYSGSLVRPGAIWHFTDRLKHYHLRVGSPPLMPIMDPLGRGFSPNCAWSSVICLSYLASTDATL